MILIDDDGTRYVNILFAIVNVLSEAITEFGLTKLVKNGIRVNKNTALVIQIAPFNKAYTRSAENAIFK